MKLGFPLGLAASAMVLLGCGSHHDGGGADAGPPPTVIPQLTFAVIGDTRPSIPEDTSSYPTAIITQIFQDIAAESPVPQFVVATGDYMFTFGGAAQQMLDIFMTARKAFSGPMYPAMGNHECDELTNVNCAGSGSQTTDYTTYMNTMMSPLQLLTPYYDENFVAPDNSWSAHFTFIACNYWDSTQEAWEEKSLATPATYHFVVRHLDVADLSTSPCTDSQPPVAANPLTIILAGHVHEYEHNPANNEIVDGLGGAPLDAGTNYGYTLVTRNSDGTLTVTTYDYKGGSTIDSFSIKADGTAS
jgi:hypothetical protein